MIESHKGEVGSDKEDITSPESQGQLLRLRRGHSGLDQLSVVSLNMSRTLVGRKGESLA